MVRFSGELIICLVGLIMLISILCCGCICLWMRSRCWRIFLIL